jgi:hypothetical protein
MASGTPLMDEKGDIQEISLGVSFPKHLQNQLSERVGQNRSPRLREEVYL